MNYLLLVLVIISFALLYYVNRKFKVSVEEEDLIIRLVHRVVKVHIREISEIMYLTKTDFGIPFVSYDSGVLISWNGGTYPIVLGPINQFSESNILLIKTIIEKNNKVQVSKNLEELVK